ncbi:hypothetical protein HX109_03690 [Galbibacter sp. BG1]|uniref:hypothetical protein n=1 Tax=Galbibacter sp. BG1 TaxID=1170699 RepID=UPI0015B8AB30|nr:hypothetical protein [Galbibacter sp. BG1]QLE00707.1 hypothetical protein HX109_03690 [Galbibacter sp. BG1]
MFLKKMCFFVFTFSCIVLYAQNDTFTPKILYVDAIINYEGKIKISDKIMDLQSVQKYIRSLVRNQSVLEYDEVVYRVYADEKLELGTIMDLEQELQKAFTGKRERYLLNTKGIILDEPDIWNHIKSLEIKAIED